jgi:soluble lytic murein transglycosylase-like protein
MCVRYYAAHYCVPREFVAALIDVESAWNPRAVSQKGAMGLMQLMPATAKRFGASDPFNPEQNIAAGTRYVTTLMWEFHGDLRLVSAAYYAGDRGVAREQLNYHNPDVVAYVEEVRKRYMLRAYLIARPSRRSVP